MGGKQEGKVNSMEETKNDKLYNEKITELENPKPRNRAERRKQEKENRRKKKRIIF